MKPLNQESPWLAKTRGRRAETAGDGDQPHRVSLEEPQAVQGICEGEKALLREEIRSARRSCR